VSIVFGDWEPDDSLDTEPPAPEQVAYKLHALRREIDALTGPEGLTWDQLTIQEQQLGVAIGQAIVNYIVMADPDVPEDAARNLHNVRRFLASSTLPPWEDLSPDDRRVGIALMELIINWLQRQGALA
jgi:hypothetical protein